MDNNWVGSTEITVSDLGFDIYSVLVTCTDTTSVTGYNMMVNDGYKWVFKLPAIGTERKIVNGTTFTTGKYSINDYFSAYCSIKLIDNKLTFSSHFDSTRTPMPMKLLPHTLTNITIKFFA